MYPYLRQLEQQWSLAMAPFAIWFYGAQSMMAASMVHATINRPQQRERRQ